MAERPVDDYNGKKKSFKEKKLGRLIIISVMSLICIIVYIAGISVGENKVKETIVEKVVEKEVIKYVEQSKTLTKDFLVHLNSDLDPRMADVIAEEIDKASKKYRLPRKLICAIMRQESKIDPFAKSHVGAVGLMQVMPKIHKEKYEGRNLWHISTNVDVGCEIFREYLDKEKGNMDKAFHRYLSKNASKKEVKEYQGKIEHFWAKLEMYEYLSNVEQKENQEEPKELNVSDIMNGDVDVENTKSEEQSN